MKTETGYVLAKIGRSDYMPDLVENGTVYMQRLRAYTTLEDRTGAIETKG